MRHSLEKHISSLLPFFFFICFGQFVAAQSQQLKGRILTEKNRQPVVSANITLLYQAGRSFSDATGNFSLFITSPRKNDTLLISMVGYETLRLPLTSAIGKTEFTLKEKATTLETVTVKTFSTHDVQGAMSESVGYIRSWNSRGNGNEIGRIFQLPYQEYKIDRVRFKVSNMCDTCLIRLHIHKLLNGLPDEELLKDSIAIYVNKLALDDKAPEFDLREKDLTFRESSILVSFEVLHCGLQPGKNCYFSFAGTDKGEYIYKSREKNEWTSVNDEYTIYVKLFLRY